MHNGFPFCTPLVATLAMALSSQRIAAFGFSARAFTPFTQIHCGGTHKAAKYVNKTPLVMQKINILLVDDHSIVRQGLKALLESESDLAIVAEAQTGREAVQLASKLRPDIVLMDLAMPFLNGWEATRQILKAVSSTKIVVLSTY